MFPPSDGNSLDSSNENPNGNGGSTAAVDERRGQDLIPYAGGLSAPGGMPWGLNFPTRPEILNAKPDFSNLLHALRRRKWLGIVLGLLLGGGVAAGAWTLLPPRYESAATLQVKILSPIVFSEGMGNLDFGTYKSNMNAMITRNPLVLNAALADRTIQDIPLVRKNALDPVAWLQETLNVDFTSGGELVRVGMIAEDPDGLDQIVNAVVSAYLKDIVEKERTDKLTRRDTLDKKVRAYKADVLKKERELFNLTQQIGTADAQTARTRIKMEADILDTLMRSRNETFRLISDFSVKMELIKLMRDNAEKQDVKEEDLDAVINRDPTIVQEMNDLGLLHRELREVERVVRNKNDPAVLRVREAIANLEQSIDETKADDRRKLLESIKNQSDPNSSNMKALELQRGFYEKEYENLTKQAEDQSANVQKLERFSGDAEQLRSDIDESKGIARDMSTTLDRWNIELDADPRVTLTQPATKAKPKDPWRQYLAASFAGVVGFGLALVGVTFFEFLSRRLNSATEVADGLGIRVMGDLPALRRGRIALRSRSRRALHGLVAESINGIRATLVRNSDIGTSHVFMVTSANEQEGKTTVASQLAASLARAGRRTLLLDCDLRHPGGHLVFGLSNDDGLCELLREEALIDDVIRATPADNLWMVTSGRCCANAVLALGKDEMARIIDELKARFEFIVIDTGPVLKVADALLLGPHVDGAILSALRDVSQIHKVYEANERLKLAGVNVVGAVINGIEDGGSLDRYHVEMPAA